MKKVAPLILILIFFGFVIIFLANQSDQDMNIEYVNSLSFDTKEDILVCILNEDNKLVLVNTKKHNDENIYIYILKLYDHYRNSLPLSYKSPLKGNFEIENVKKVGNVLNIDIKILYLEGEINTFLNALIWSYQDYGIEKAVVNIDDNVFVVNKNANINTVIEGSDIYNTHKQIIYWDNNKDVLPITYYHSYGKLEFLMEKVKSKYGNINYDIQVVDSFVIINIDDEENYLSNNIISLIIKSVNVIEEFSEIVIILNEVNVYNK